MKLANTKGDTERKMLKTVLNDRVRPDLYDMETIARKYVLDNQKL